MRTRRGAQDLVYRMFAIAVIEHYCEAFPENALSLGWLLEPRRHSLLSELGRAAQDTDQFHVTGIAERLAPYETSKVQSMRERDGADDDLVERAATLVAVMPRNQLRATIEGLISPNGLEKGRKAIDALIDAAFATEDDTGHVRLTG